MPCQGQNFDSLFLLRTRVALCLVAKTTWKLETPAAGTDIVEFADRQECRGASRRQELKFSQTRYRAAVDCIRLHASVWKGRCRFVETPMSSEINAIFTSTGCRIFAMSLTGVTHLDCRLNRTIASGKPTQGE